MVKRFEVHLVSLDPTKGAEIKKTRPCVIISPDELNRHLKTVLIAPMTSSRRDYPFRPNCTFQGTKGQIVLDQIRAVDQDRLVKKLGSLPAKPRQDVLDLLQEMFA